MLAHTEPICKRLRIAKIDDMFQISIWKFYYTLINSMFPPNMTSKTLLRHLKITYRYCRQRQVVIKMLTICK